MSSILDHVEQSVPRATVYGAMKGSPVFIGKYFREVNPSSNATDYNYADGERKITFIVASPDKTIFHDLRSAYLRFKITGFKKGGTAKNTQNKISEPASNLIERIVIKMNGTVVEDISRFDYLTSAFKKTLLKRDEKNARRREGYDYVLPSGNDGIAPQTSTDQGITGGNTVINANTTNDICCIKLDMSGIMNVQQLLSGYYSPLEIELYIGDPQVSCQLITGTNGDKADDIVISNPRLCIDQVVMSPEYVSAFESALLSNSNAQGIQIPFSTYYTYSTDVKTNDTTFWVRKPVRYLRSIYWVATYNSPQRATNYDFFRQQPIDTRIAGAGDTITKYQVAIGTKSYREIDDTNGLASTVSTTPESDIMFSKAVGHYNDYTTETDEIQPKLKKLQLSVQGIDLEFSPDNDVLASETTLNSNDVRLRIQKDTGDTTHRIMVFLNYQASIALFPGNETRLLVT